MKKYITILAVSLICHDLVAEVIPQNFQTVDDLVVNVKHAEPTAILYDTNGIIVGVRLPLACCTDRNLHLLSKIKSIRYLLICGFSDVSTNGILALADYPNLRDLCLVCGGAGSIDLVSALPCLTHLQSLKLAQDAYRTNDAIYLAKMTNLVALQIQISGSITKTRAELELLPLANLVNLRKLLIFSTDKGIKNVDASMFSRFDKLTTFVITSDLNVVEAVWKAPPEE